MSRDMGFMGRIGVLGLGLAGSLSASVLVVPGTSQIFSSGLAAPVGSGALPPSFGFAAGAGQTLTFSSVTGTVSCGGGCLAAIPADGSIIPGFTGTNIGCTSCGLSAIQFIGRHMFLIGVFLDASAPSGAGPAIMPAYTNASADGATTFSPLIGQTFFIGDGIAQLASGATQAFKVPATATRLFLGFADGAPLLGSATNRINPNAYGDNYGSLTATFTIDAGSVSAAAPEPGTLALFALGLAGLALAARKQLQ